MRKLMIATAAAMALLIPAALLAGHLHSRGHHEKVGPFFHHVSEKLELTDAQKEQVHGVFASRRGELSAEIRHLRTAHDALMRAIHSPSVDETAVRAAAREMGEAWGDLAVTHAHLARELHRVLTPEQIQKAHAMLGKLHRHFEGFLDHLEEHLATKS